MSSREMEQLELKQKRAEIQLKRLEVRKERLNMEKLKKEQEKEDLEMIEKRADIQAKVMENDRHRMMMDRMEFRDEQELQRSAQSSVFTLLIALTCTTVDEERTILGSEPFQTPILVGKNRDTALAKLMEQIAYL